MWSRKETKEKEGKQKIEIKGEFKF